MLLLQCVHVYLQVCCLQTFCCRLKQENCYLKTRLSQSSTEVSSLMTESLDIKTNSVLINNDSIDKSKFDEDITSSDNIESHPPQVIRDRIVCSISIIPSENKCTINFLQQISQMCDLFQVLYICMTVCAIQSEMYTCHAFCTD